ncbi:MAG TPA: glycosyltransferase family 4 protein [Mucilaginibacter sp.]
MKKLAIVTTHPIQYYAPVFKLLHERNNISINVYYTWGEKALDKYDPGFEQKVNWDIPLLDGYPYEWALNTSDAPGTHHFKGIINPNLAGQIIKWQPDAILFFGWAYHGHLKAIRYFKNRIPVFFRGDSTLLDETGGIKSVLKSIYLKWVYKHIDHAFNVGARNKDYFKKYGLKDSQLSFAPHAIDNDRFAEDRHAEAQLLREKLDIKSDDILILFAGKLENKKSPLLLLEAFLSIKKPGTHLLFIGNGALENALKLQADNAENIHFMPFQNQKAMPAAYQAADLFCLPSQGPGETWGLAVNEAMACGRAILVSDKVGCAIDLVKEKYNGAIFQSKHLADLIIALKKLINSKAVLHKYGHNSKDIIQDWTLARIAEAIENKLNETI